MHKSELIDNGFLNQGRQKNYKRCSRTVMDTTDPHIAFNDNGESNYWTEFRHFFTNLDYEKKAEELNVLLEDLKLERTKYDYDCIMGLSGGVDSSYLAYYATEVLGLRVLAVHVDAGWNSELAVHNIHEIVNRLNIDLETVVIDWDVMRRLQKAFVLSGLANLDVPQDHIFISSLFAVARKSGIKTILSGGNMTSECILPNSWGYDCADGWHVKSVFKNFGEGNLKGYRIYTPFQRYILYPFVYRLKSLRPLDYIPYNKEEAKIFLIKELGWRDYGGKHYESTFTKIFQSYYLPVKFGFDKRKAHLSSLIVSGQMTRDEALKILEEPLWNDKTNSEINYFCKKLNISREEFDRILTEKGRDYSDFRNSENIRKILKVVFSLYKKFLNGRHS